MEHWAKMDSELDLHVKNLLVHEQSSYLNQFFMTMVSCIYVKSS